MTAPGATPRTDALIDSLAPYLDGRVTQELEHHARELETELAAAQLLLSEGNRWIPVSERLPEDHVTVLVRVAATPFNNPAPWIGSGLYTADVFGPEENEAHHWEVAGPLGWCHPCPVTHWMPMPGAPK